VEQLLERPLRHFAERLVRLLLVVVVVVVVQLVQHFVEEAVAVVVRLVRHSVGLVELVEQLVRQLVELLVEQLVQAQKNSERTPSTCHAFPNERRAADVSVCRRFIFVYSRPLIIFR